MSGEFESIVEIDRPVEQVFAYLADGRHDPEFSPRVQEITKTPDGPTAVGTIFRSTVKDAGMKSGREFRIVGYDLDALPGGRTRVRIFNTLEGHGFGKLLVGLALSAARRDAPDFGRRIKAAA
ncbi:SRPBCC family protein, partial [Streptomyces goshikiensis]|uniref:SRPBCC family protein n=1 Tax=Streptomyces goshikiensis TaxID=1942 RepID=UPI0036AD90F4